MRWIEVSLDTPAESIDSRCDELAERTAACVVAHRQTRQALLARTRVHLVRQRPREIKHVAEDSPPLPDHRVERAQVPPHRCGEEVDAHRDWHGGDLERRLAEEGIDPPHKSHPQTASAALALRVPGIALGMAIFLSVHAE